MAVPVSPIATQERRQVELVDDVEDEPGEVVFGQPVTQIRRQQEGLVAVAAKEVVGHGATYLFALFIPDVLVPKSLAPA
jgi:phytoene dehydrogenase-like protein